MPENNKRSVKNILPWILGGLVILSIGLHFRLYSFTHNTSSDEYEQATMLVLSQLRASITKQCDTAFAHLPPAERQRIAQTKFNETLRNNNSRIRKTFDQVGLQLLKKSGNQKHYLQESDSYYFLDLTQNILEKGDVSKKIDGSRYFNEKMLAPVGYWEPQTWHPYIGAWVYKAARLFDPDIDLMTGLGFTPLLLFPIVLAAFIFACRGMNCDWPSTLTASVFMALAPIYLQRSTFAWYDNDTYSVLFPLLNLGLLFYALKNITSTGKTVIWGILAGISFALYARFWTGWGFSWGISLAALMLITLRSFFFKEQHRKNLGLLLGITVLAPLCVLIAMVGIKQFLELIPFAYGELKKFAISELKGWPDLFIVVGELHSATLPEVILLTGGPLVFTGALLAFLTEGQKVIFKRKNPPEFIIFLVLFCTATLLLGLNSERFTILLVPPLILAFAWGLELLWRSSAFLTDRFKIPELHIKTFFLALFLGMALIPVALTQNTIASLLHPIFNSSWEKALTQLNKKTPPESVVNTWWSPGHFVKAVAKRGVTFDGASIKGEQAYWLTKVYLSQDEKEALGILRMLNTSSNQAAEFLQKKGWPLSRAVPLLAEITAMSKNSASKRLKPELPAEDIKTLLNFTHKTPPPSYMLIYNEIVEGNVLLGYVGKWDFKKIEALNNDRKSLAKIPPKKSPRYIDFLWDLVGGQLRQSETLAPSGIKDTTILFDQGVLINTADMSVQVNSSKFGKGIPASIVYLDETSHTVVEKTFPEATLSYSVLFFKDRTKTPSCILMDRLLANSLIMKMYYFDGAGLQYFKPFAKEEDLSGRTKIFIYQVKWPKGF